MIQIQVLSFIAVVYLAEVFFKPENTENLSKSIDWHCEICGCPFYFFIVIYYSQ